MMITQETANLVDTLANAAAKIGSTAASAKLNKLIVDLLPTPAEDQSIAEALRQDNADLESQLDSAVTAVESFRDQLAGILNTITDDAPYPELLARLKDLHSQAAGWIVEHNA